MLELRKYLQEQLPLHGVGRRSLGDGLFAGDTPPPRLGVYDEDDESLCHQVTQTPCSLPWCTFTAQTLLEAESHYNTAHRYACGSCRRALPSPHLLALHVQETHDSYFKVMAQKKPSYSCYIEECKETFLTPTQRLHHCVTIHKIPKDFRFDQKPKTKKQKDQKKPESGECSMELDPNISEKKFYFNNSKGKTFTKFTGKKFTTDKVVGAVDVNMDGIVEDLKESLPKV